MISIERRLNGIITFELDCKNNKETHKRKRLEKKKEQILGIPYLQFLFPKLLILLAT